MSYSPDDRHKKQMEFTTCTTKITKYSKLKSELYRQNLQQKVYAKE